MSVAGTKLVSGYILFFAQKSIHSYVFLIPPIILPETDNLLINNGNYPNLKGSMTPPNSTKLPLLLINPRYK